MNAGPRNGRIPNFWEPRRMCSPRPSGRSNASGRVAIIDRSLAKTKSHAKRSASRPVRRSVCGCKPQSDLLRAGSPDDVEIREVPMLLLEVEAVAGEELVRDDEADVANGQVVDEATVRTVEKCRGDERMRLAELERLAEKAQRQTGVDDVLDKDHVPALELRVEVLEQADPARPAELRIGAEAGELDEVDRVEDRNRPREVGEEDDRR